MTTTNKDYYPVFEEILRLFEKHQLPGNVGEALLAFTLGYARGIRQQTMLDFDAIDNIHHGWKAGASTEIVTLTEDAGQ